MKPCASLRAKQLEPTAALSAQLPASVTDVEACEHISGLAWRRWPRTDELRRVVDELNLTISAIAPEKELRIDLIRWETHVAPGLGPPQVVVNQQIGDYDIFIGILWKRVGTPTGVARSGTEEEFLNAKKKWESDKSRPVMFYFCQAPFPPPRSIEDVEQLRRVTEFRLGLATSGLVAEYACPDTFADVVRPHLLLTIGKLGIQRLSKGVAGLSAAASEADSPIAFRKVEELALKYETIRRETDPGDSRTRQFEIVASNMRSLALAGRSFVDRLMASDSAGLRLAAVSFLESLPAVQSLPWLGQRVATERPFVGYRAAMALLAAARNLPPADLPAVAKTLREVKESLTAKGRTGTDRWAIISQAEFEVLERQATHLNTTERAAR